MKRSDAAHDPLRIVVAGGSVSLMVVPSRTASGRGTYGELLERRLLDRGIPVRVHHSGNWFGLIDQLRERYEWAVRNHFPDVVILQYGMGEAQPNVLPTWLLRHGTTWNQGGSALARWYRRNIMNRLWRVLRGWQRRASRAAGMRTWRMHPKRFDNELSHLVEMVRAETGALVLVIDLDPPGPKMEHFIPGYTERWRHWQRHVRGIVQRLAAENDGAVRIVEGSLDLTSSPEALQELLPDGLHRTERGHELMADRLLAEILDWLNEELP